MYQIHCFDNGSSRLVDNSNELRKLVLAAVELSTACAVVVTLNPTELAPGVRAYEREVAIYGGDVEAPLEYLIDGTPYGTYGRRWVLYSVEDIGDRLLAAYDDEDVAERADRQLRALGWITYVEVGNAY